MPRIIALDVETTGLEPTDKIVEIGLIDIEESGVGPSNGFYLGDAASSLIDPKIPIPIPAMAVHHITDEMVMGVPDDPATTLMDMIFMDTVSMENKGDFPDFIVAHNAKFDRQFIDPLIDEYSQRDNFQWICTYKVAAHLYRDAPSHKNAAVFYYLELHRGIYSHLVKGVNLHRAAPDAAITAAIFCEMTRKLTLDEMVEISSKPTLQSKIGFGKHRGKSWDDIDMGYINWILSKSEDFDEDVVYTARCQKIERSTRG